MHIQTRLGGGGGDNGGGDVRLDFGATLASQWNSVASFGHITGLATNTVPSLVVLGTPHNSIHSGREGVAAENQTMADEFVRMWRARMRSEAESVKVTVARNDSCWCIHLPLSDRIPARLLICSLQMAFPISRVAWHSSFPHKHSHRNASSSLSLESVEHQTLQRAHPAKKRIIEV